MSEPFTSVTLISLLRLFSVSCNWWCILVWSPCLSHFQQPFLNSIVSSNSFLLQNPHWPLLVFLMFFSEELQPAEHWLWSLSSPNIPSMQRDSNTSCCSTMLTDFLNPQSGFIQKQCSDLTVNIQSYQMGFKECFDRFHIILLAVNEMFRSVSYFREAPTQMSDFRF